MIDVQIKTINRFGTIHFMLLVFNATSKPAKITTDYARY